MEEPRERAWTPAGAVRVGANNVEGTALGGTAGAHPSGEEAQRRGEVEAMEAEARGTFTPKPWSQDGGTGEFFDGVRGPVARRPHACARWEGFGVLPLMAL